METGKIQYNNLYYAYRKIPESSYYYFTGDFDITLFILCLLTILYQRVNGPRKMV